jgi:hypothetical protein
MKRNIFVDLIAILFILLFAYTASDKLIHVHIFQDALKKSPLIGKFATLVSYTIPVIEIAVIALLLFYNRIGLYASLILISLFTLYLGYMIIFAPHLPCTCGGIISKLTWKQHLVLNSFFILLALTGIYLQRKKPKNNSVAYNVATV